MRLEITGTVVKTYAQMTKKGAAVPHIVVNDGEEDLPIRCWKRGLTDGVGVGVEVQVSAVLKGRAWQDKWFVDLEAESVSITGQPATRPAPSESSDPDGPPPDDDIPF